MAHWGACDPHVGTGDAVSGCPRGTAGIRPAHRRAAFYGNEGRGPRLWSTSGCWRSIPTWPSCSTTHRSSAITMSVNGLERLCSLPNVVGVKEASFNQQHLHRGAPDPRTRLGHQHARRVDLLQGAGAGDQPAGNVRQHVRLAVRHPRRQQLRALDRTGLPGETWTRHFTTCTCDA